MTGKEAQEILDDLNYIKYNLINDYDREAFFRMGRLHERLAQIVAIDMSSFNPTVSKKDIVEEGIKEYELRDMQQKNKQVILLLQ